MWRGDARDQFAQYVCSTRRSKRSNAARKARAQAAPISKKERILNAPDDRWGWPSLVGCRPSYLRCPTSQTRQLSILVNDRSLCRLQFTNCRAQALRTVCIGNPSYRSGSKGVKSVILWQKVEFSPTAGKKRAWHRCDINCSNCAGNCVVSMHCGVVVGCQTPFLGGGQSSHRPSVEPAGFSV